MSPEPAPPESVTLYHCQAAETAADNYSPVKAMVADRYIVWGKVMTGRCVVKGERCDCVAATYDRRAA